MGSGVMQGALSLRVRVGLGVLIGAWAVVAWAAHPVYAIDVKLTMEEAKKALAAGREPMEKANTPEDVKKLLQQAALATRVGADPEKDPCGASAVLRTKRYWLESFGRKEATESKKQKTDVRMPDDKIRKYLDMPNLEMEVQLCGDDEYFADGVQIALQQGSKTVKPVDASPPDKGRKNEGQGPAYRTRFTARFAYDSFDSNAKTKVVVFFPDGKMTEFEADFSKVR
ncbi:MAG: hypothetical protein FJ249_02825 [Nitrospira sp.]|nr:hypothetical protein [Nitrospira sp.]